MYINAFQILKLYYDICSNGIFLIRITYRLELTIIMNLKMESNFREFSFIGLLTNMK